MNKNIKYLIESFIDIEDEIEDINLSFNRNTFVDLGLPSGTLWAKCNIGAEKEFEYGEYYKWGETDHTIETYEKYNLDDELTKLEFEDDIAYQLSKGLFRIPSKQEIDELLKYTNAEWIDNYENTGNNGIIFKSKVYNNYIFIPAAGWIYNRHITNKNESCYIWSSTNFLEFSRTSSAHYYAYYANFSPTYKGTDEDDRNVKCSIRPVINI